ncbi:GCG_CRPN prefix-to-repeats domain-containing protein [Glacieibacterium sp.]|uniref:GCG_CRPN prefix-to-repeats domain-containing protein n=1 Tax=Glacieibacterium sp. TaxID=2860237 RepID=UPI003AFFA174
MRLFLLAAIAAGAAFTATAPVEARQGCGAGGHRGPAGYCRPNRGRPVVVVPALRIGGFYPGRGYWDGRRYWAHRDRWHGGWRYR